MECNPGTFEKIVQMERFDVKPVVLENRDLIPVRYAFSDESPQPRTRSSDVHDAAVRLCFHLCTDKYKQAPC